MKNKNAIRKIIFSFLLKIFIWTAIVVTLILVLINLFNNMDFQWLFEFSPSVYYSMRGAFYYVSHSLGCYGIILGIWLIGTSIILYFYLRKVFNYYIETISKEALNISNKDVKTIELPNELENIQATFNILKLDYEKEELNAKDNEQRKNDLIVYLAHDLKTPLTSLIGYLSLLNEIKDMPKKQREKYLKIVLDKSYRLEDLINELFDITRFNAEKIVLKKETIDLNLMLDQIVDDFYPILNENNKKVVTNYEKKITIYGDSNRLARVFNNLLKNAIYYSSDSKINVDMKQKNNIVYITISNKVKNVNNEDLQKMFEKFYRLDNSRTSKTGGSGIGLAIAKEIIELHKGKISSKLDNDSISFNVELPLN